MEEYREIGKKADVRKPAQEANEAASNSHEFEPNKGTKLLLKVIKAIIIMGVKFSHLATD